MSANNDNKHSYDPKYTETLLRVLRENEKNLSNFTNLKKRYEDLDHALKRISNKGIDPNIYRLLNFVQFAALSSNDLNIALYEVSDPKLYSLDWEMVKLFHTKTLALIIFEILQDFVRLLPKPMYEVVSKFDVKDEYTKRLKELHSELNEMRKEEFEYLKDIRNRISAHKDDDAYLQLAIIRGIDTVRVVKIADKLKVWLNNVFAILPTILLKFHERILQDSGLKSKITK